MAMFAANYWPRQTIHPLLLGGTTSAVGIAVLAWAIHAQRTTVIYGMMALVGHGIGLRLNPGSMHGLAYFPDMTAMVTCLACFAMPFGGLVGLTIMSTVFNNKNYGGKEGAKNGVTWAFIAMIPLMLFSLLVTLFLGNVWILEGGGHEVVEGVYLWKLVTRKPMVKKRMTRGHEPSKQRPVDGETKV